MNRTSPISLLMILCISSFVFAQQFAGSYVTTITDADVSPDTKAILGKWELILTDEGPFTLLQNGEVVVHGSYTVTDTNISFSDSEGKLACQEQDAGVYTAVLDKETLTLKLVEDNCAGRRIVMLSHALLKQKKTD